MESTHPSDVDSCSGMHELETSEASEGGYSCDGDDEDDGMESSSSNILDTFFFAEGEDTREYRDNSNDERLSEASVTGSGSDEDGQGHYREPSEPPVFRGAKKVPTPFGFQLERSPS